MNTAWLKKILSIFIFFTKPQREVNVYVASYRAIPPQHQALIIIKLVYSKKTAWIF